MTKAQIMFMVLLLVFFYGSLLIFLVKKQKTKNPLKKFLLISSFSAIGFPLFAVLHNFFYALQQISQRFALISGLMGFLHAVCFLISTIICPLGFGLGTVVSLVILLKKKSS